MDGESKRTASIVGAMRFRAGVWGRLGNLFQQVSENDEYLFGDSLPEVAEMLT